MDHAVETLVPSDKVGEESAAGELTTPVMLRLLVFVPVILLVVFGIVMVYSSSMVFSLKRFGDATYFFDRQLVFAGLGLVVMLVASRLPVELYRRFTYPLLAVSLVGLLWCLTPFGTITVKGATRWINIAGGFNVQPSEIAKVAIVFYASYFLVKKSESIKSFRVGFLPPVIVAGAAAFMCLRQPDFGAAAMILGLIFVMLFVGGVRVVYLALAGGTAAGLGYLLVRYNEYRWRRITGFLNPEMDPQGINYQINESLISIGSGGVWGMGLGNGKQKLFFLPDAHTDFIASIVGEELGMVGIMVMLLLFATVVTSGVIIARRARTEYGSLLAAGLTFYIAFQVVVNLMVVMSLLPTKGLALPFMSYGGSSLVTNLFAAGVIMSVARDMGRADPAGEERETTAGGNRRLESEADDDEHQEPA
jgi:cell division protein FtsW